MLKINAKGSIDELKALYNLLNEAERVQYFRSGILQKDKSIVDGKQSFEVILKGERRYDERRERPARDKSGEVYLLATDREGVYKIGESKTMQDRKATFNVKLPFPVKVIHIIRSNDRFATEKALKTKYRKEGKCLNGSEFFQLTDEDVAFIQSL